MSRSCIVVGAGPAGLSAAHRLANAGLRVTVLEAANVIGGRTRSERVGDCLVNTGSSFIASFYDATLALLRELQLESVPLNHQHGVVATPFGKLELDLGSVRRVLRFPLISFSGKARAAAMFARAALRRRVHIAKPARLARYDRGETVERWGLRTLGETAYHYLLRTGIEPSFYVGCEETSAAVAKALVHHALDFKLLVLPAGMGALCDALAARLEVRTGCQASGVEVRDGSVVVHHAGGTLEADYAILAAPATAIAKLDGNLAEADRTDAATVRYSPNIALFFGYERPITVQYPLVTPAGPGRHPLARVRTWSALAPAYVGEGKELLAVHASGWRSAELLERDASQITAALRADAEDIFGRLADPDWIRLYPRREATVITAPGHFRRMAAFLRRPRKRLLYAGDWLTGSTVEGAVQTGLSAAERILKGK
ncbi:MAG: protoporphyrinogen/coproporphyrinogen oxidase [Candidatus Binatia bacterium]